VTIPALFAIKTVLIKRADCHTQTSSEEQTTPPSLELSKNTKLRSLHIDGFDPSPNRARGESVIRSLLTIPHATVKRLSLSICSVDPTTTFSGESLPWDALDTLLCESALGESLRGLAFEFSTPIMTSMARTHAPGLLPRLFAHSRVQISITSRRT
jgi:hypothetical protein